MPLPRMFAFRRRVSPPAADEATRAMKYVHRKSLLKPGNRIEALCTGEQVFPAMLEAIASATRFVHLATYIIRDDRTGRRFLQALVERARAGVSVRLLYDGLGSFDLSDRFVEELRAGGVHVGEFHPIAPWREHYGFNQRDHMKLLVADGEIGFTGGINIGDEYASLSDGGGGWYDVQARAEGPIVADLDRLFVRTWERATGQMLPTAAESRRAPPPPHMQAAVIDNLKLRNRSSKRIAYMHAIRAANSTVSIMNAYFIPDLGLRRALRYAAGRGVLVKIIVPSVSDVNVVMHASRHLYPRLLRAGVRIYEWPERMMHAKTGVIDGLWSTIGSYNIDRRSLFLNLEASIVIADGPFGARMQEIFDAELAKSREITLAECLQRPLLVRAKQWFCYQWRYWL
ncbi:MAG TPA: phospholipase D-like domain-containing protein [Planctomycetota bacterium]|nr:phospholipase D-like domain-containing protein [Planctomycetota bacterium]